MNRTTTTTDQTEGGVTGTPPSSVNGDGAAPFPGQTAPQTTDGVAVEKQVIVAGAETRVTTGDRDQRQQRRPAGQSPLHGLLGAFSPNRAVSPTTMGLIVGTQIVLLVLLWIASPFAVLPRPGEVIGALSNLWLTQGLGPELFTSFRLSVTALFWTALISLTLSYLTVLPFFRPLAAAVSKARFLSLAGFTLVFTLMVGGGYPLKLSLLVFGMTVFFVTSMASVVAEIPKETFDHARTLRMGEWRVVWEVVVLGTLDKALRCYGKTRPSAGSC
jgi:NitT/TauT family transport system permease protein